MYVITFICNPSNPILSNELVSKYCKAFEGISVNWLNYGIAADITIPEIPNEFKKYWVELQTRKIDMVIQKEKYRKKRLLVADMDSTIIEQESLDELAYEVGCGKKISEITKQAMEGNLEFEDALNRRVDYLKGTPISTINKVMKNRITLSPGAKTLISTMQKNNVYSALISGGFTHFTSKIAQELGFNESKANQFEIINEKLTGVVISPILGKEAKVDFIRTLTKKYGLSYIDVIAVGDGANDIGMLELAGSGVAIHAKEIVQSKANFIINHSDLSALLYIQGYNFNEFIN